MAPSPDSSRPTTEHDGSGYGIADDDEKAPERIVAARARAHRHAAGASVGGPCPGDALQLDGQAPHGPERPGGLPVRFLTVPAFGDHRADRGSNSSRRPRESAIGTTNWFPGRGAVDVEEHGAYGLGRGPRPRTPPSHKRPVKVSYMLPKRAWRGLCAELERTLR